MLAEKRRIYRRFSARLDSRGCPRCDRATNRSAPAGFARQRWRDARRTLSTVPRPAFVSARVRGASAVVVTPSVRGQQPELVAGSRAAVASCRASSARAASRHACFEMRGVPLGSLAARTRPEPSSSSWPRQSAAKRSLMPGLQISISDGGHSRRNGAPSDPAARPARCDAVGHRDARSRGGSGPSRQPLDGRGRGIGCGLSVSGCGARVPRAQRGGRRRDLEREPRRPGAASTVELRGRSWIAGAGSHARDPWARRGCVRGILKWQAASARARCGI